MALSSCSYPWGVGWLFRALCLDLLVAAGWAFFFLVVPGQGQPPWAVGLRKLQSHLQLWLTTAATSFLPPGPISVPLGSAGTPGLVFGSAGATVDPHGTQNRAGPNSPAVGIAWSFCSMGSPSSLASMTPGSSQFIRNKK